VRHCSVLPNKVHCCAAAVPARFVFNEWLHFLQRAPCSFHVAQNVRVTIATRLRIVMALTAFHRRQAENGANPGLFAGMLLLIYQFPSKQV
jgi:hypothetical protein